MNKDDKLSENKIRIFEHLKNPVVFGTQGFKLDAYLLAYEGWRRGLTLTWYLDETVACKLHRLNSSTHGKFFSLASKEDKHYFFRSRGDMVANKTVNLVQNKEKTKALLKEAGVPVPIGKEILINEDEKITLYANEIGYPVVVKPVSGSMGKAVFTNIDNEDELRNIINYYKNNYHYESCLIEKYYAGKEYRIYVVGDQVVAATNRVPANVVGDGMTTIKGLIEQKNKKRKLNPYLASKPIKVNYEVERNLESQKRTLESIPMEGQQVFLHTLSNLSAGGDPIDATDELTDSIKQIAVDALKALPSIPHAGVDIIVDEKNEESGVVLEVNATAEIAFHLFPLEGISRDIPKAIIDYYFPETKTNRKAQFYFEFKSILSPLETWSASRLTVTRAPRKKLYGMKYTVSGKVEKVGYRNWIRRQALMRKLHGYAKNIDKNTIEIFVIGTNQEKLIDFKSKCEKGSKNAVVKNILTEEIKITDNDYFQLGFQIK